MSITVLFIGDIVGRLARTAVEKALPALQKKYAADFVIANVENIAHGKGVTIRTLTQMQQAGVNAFTSGNHVFRNKEYETIFAQDELPLIRPANYPSQAPGCGYRVFKISQKNICVLNLQGRVFMHDLVDNPFTVFDNVMKQLSKKKIDYYIVDFHGEATSEKQAFAYYADGRVSAVVGTHTHVQTADERVLPGGSAYITDVGFVGGTDTVLGVQADPIIHGYTTALPVRHTFPEEGDVTLNAVCITLDSTVAIKRITKIISC